MDDATEVGMRKERSGLRLGSPAVSGGGMVHTVQDVMILYDRVLYDMI